MYWSHLPGPRRFLERLVEDFREGKSAVLYLPSVLPADFHRRLAEYFREEGFHPEILTPDGTEAMRPMQFLAERLLPDAVPSVRDLTEMLLDGELAGRLLWIDRLPDEAWPAWKSMLQDYAQMARSRPVSERVLFFFPLPGYLAQNEPRAEVTVSVRLWRGVVSDLDTRLFVWTLMPDDGEAPIFRRLRVEMITSLALWDLELAELLCGLDLGGLCQPWDVLADLAAERGWTQAVEPTWYEGMVDIVDGRHVEHTSWLQVRGRREDRDEIERRLWKAQVGVLLPRVEEERRAILPQVASHLTLPVKTPFGIIKEPLDLEIGPLYEQVRHNPRVRRDVRDRLRILRKIRNNLAHLELVDPNLLRQL